MEFVYYLQNLYSAIRLNTIQYTKADEGWSYPNHRHPYFEFLYCAAGEIEQWINGRKYILHPGDAAIIKMGSYHETAWVSNQTVFFDFHFDVEVEEVFNLFSIMLEPTIRSSHEQSEDNPIAHWVQRFIADYGADHNHSEQSNEPAGSFHNIRSSVRLLQMHSRILEFISILAEYILSSRLNELETTARVTPSQVRIAQEVAYMLESNASTGIKVSEVASRLNIHRSYLSFCFHNLYGISPSAYLVRARINEAKQLLQESDWSIEEISNRLCFSSAGHFSRTFKSIMDISPIQYRNHLNKQQ